MQCREHASTPVPKESLRCTNVHDQLKNLEGDIGVDGNISHHLHKSQDTCTACLLFEKRNEGVREMASAPAVEYGAQHGCAQLDLIASYGVFAAFS